MRSTPPGLRHESLSELDHPRGVVPFATSPVTSLVAIYPNTVALEIARPMRMAEGPYLYLTRRPTRLISEFGSKCRIGGKTVKFRIARTTDRRGVMRENDDVAMWFVRCNILNSGIGPSQILAVQCREDGRIKAANLLEVTKRVRHNIEFSRVESSPEGAPEDS